MYTMTLNDGSTIDELTLKGCCLCSKKELTPGMFLGKLNPVTVSGKAEEGEEEYDYRMLVGYHSHMELLFIRHADGEYRAGFRDIPDEEYDRAQMAGNIEYLAMMTGVEL